MVLYDESWLPTDARNMGLLFEQCELAMKDLYGIELDIEKFLPAFMASDVRRKMEGGHPRLLSQSYIDNIECFIHVDCDDNYEQFIRQPNTEAVTYFPLERLWIGKMYVKIAYHCGLTSADLLKRLPLSLMRQHYLTGHEISEASYLESVKEILEPFKN